MLVTEFYKIENLDFNTQTGDAKGCFSLNPDHEIYNGHFPSQPVVPGVMQIQIIREICENVLNKKLFISESQVVKFINMIIPNDSERWSFEINIKETESAYKIDSKILTELNTIFKAKMLLIC